jgi:hypothetical protein
VNGPNSFRCSCPTGFSGELCQNPHDESVNLISCNLSLYSKLLICLAIIASFFLALSIPIYRRRRLARKSLKQSRSSTTTSETSSADPEKHVEAEGKEFRNFVNPKHHPKPAVSFDVDPSTLKTTTLSVVNTCRACEEKNRYVSESFGFGPAPVNPSCDSRRLNSISAWSHHLEEDLHRRRPSYEEVLQPTSTTTIRRHPLQSPPPPPPYDENFYVSHETSNDDGGLRRLFTGPEIVYGGTIAESGIYEEIFSDQPIYYRHHYNT